MKSNFIILLSKCGKHVIFTIGEQRKRKERKEKGMKWNKIKFDSVRDLYFEHGDILIPTSSFSVFLFLQLHKLFPIITTFAEFIVRAVVVHKMNTKKKYIISRQICALITVLL